LRAAKTLVSALSFRPSPLLLCPLPRENSPGRWTTITTGENQDAHTKRQRQNRRSRIFQEDGEEQNPVSVAREWVAQATSLKAGVTVTLSDVSRYGDVQVEIRTNGTLNWRAWSFEPDFLFELKRNLQYVQL
jgi:hypothetical protein